MSENVMIRGAGRLEGDRRWLLWFALAYAVSGVFHLGVWAVDGGAWAGDVSWRKPIVFGLSGAVTTASLAWALGAVKPGRQRARGVLIYLVAMTLEIALITMQRWRGVGSHFNDATPFDALVFAAMGALILTAAAPIVRWAWQVSRDRGLEPERRVAVAGGLWLLIAGVVVGVGIAQLGTVARAIESAQLVATARALVLPHALGVHAIQGVMLLERVLPRWVPSAGARVRWLLRAVALGGLAIVAAVFAAVLM